MAGSNLPLDEVWGLLDPEEEGGRQGPSDDHHDVNLEESLMVSGRLEAQMTTVRY